MKPKTLLNYSRHPLKKPTHRPLPILIEDIYVQNTYCIDYTVDCLDSCQKTFSQPL